MTEQEITDAWLTRAPDAAPSVLATWDGLAHITLSQIGREARLMWVFD